MPNISFVMAVPLLVGCFLQPQVPRLVMWGACPSFGPNTGEAFLHRISAFRLSSERASFPLGVLGCVVRMSGVRFSDASPIATLNVPVRDSEAHVCGERTALVSRSRRALTHAAMKLYSSRTRWISRIAQAVAQTPESCPIDWNAEPDLAAINETPRHVRHPSGPGRRPPDDIDAQSRRRFVEKAP